MKSLLLPLSLLPFLGCAGLHSSFSLTTAESFPAEGITTVDLTTFNGSVSVTTNETQSIDVEAELSARAATGEEAKKICKSLEYDAENRDARFVLTAVKPPSVKNASISLKVAIPKDCHLNIKTNNGTVTVSNRIGDVDVKTSNGRVTCSDVTGSIHVVSSNGAVTLEDCDGSAQVTTSNGAVKYSGHLAGVSNKLASSNGGITLKVSDSRATHFKASTTNGKINCSVGSTQISASGKRNMDAIVGDQTNGEVAEIELKTSNGSINIQEMEPALTETTLTTE